MNYTEEQLEEAKAYLNPKPNSERWLSLDDLPNEEWRDVVGYEGLYQVSNYGRAKSLRRLIDYGKGKGKRRFVGGSILKCRFDDKRYIRVVLSYGNKKKNAQIHRLIAKAFIPNPDNYPCVNHKDCNPSNNYIHINADGSVNMAKSNLEWCTFQYNVTYNDAIEKRVAKFYANREQNCMAIYQYTIDGKLVGTYHGIAELEKEGFCVKAIYQCCLNKQYRVSHKGFFWSYKQLSVSEIKSLADRKYHKQIIQYDMNMNEVARHNGMIEASLAVNGNKNYFPISKCCHGHNNTAYGYKWAFAK